MFAGGACVTFGRGVMIGRVCGVLVFRYMLEGVWFCEKVWCDVVVEIVDTMRLVSTGLVAP